MPACVHGWSPLGACGICTPPAAAEKQRVWVIFSDCGLNGPWIHAVRSAKPAETSEELRRTYAERPEGGGLGTGYQHTHVEEWEVDGAESRNAG